MKISIKEIEIEVSTQELLIMPPKAKEMLGQHLVKEADLDILDKQIKEKQKALEVPGVPTKKIEQPPTESPPKQKRKGWSDERRKKMAEKTKIRREENREENNDGWGEEDF